MAYLGLEKFKDKFNENEVKFDEDKKNENDIKNCQIFIEGKKIPFSYYYKFKKSGTYRIIFSFHNKLKSLCNMFFSCESLTNIDLSNFNSSNIITMSFMFYYCKSLVSINISSFNTQKVTNMEYMFSKCKSLIKLDLSNFNTKKVINMGNMFNDCDSLKILDLNNFNTQNVTNMKGMFHGTKINISDIICYDKKLIENFVKESLQIK